MTAMRPDCFNLQTFGYWCVRKQLESAFGKPGLAFMAVSLPTFSPHMWNGSYVSQGCPLVGDSNTAPSFASLQAPKYPKTL